VGGVHEDSMAWKAWTCSLVISARARAVWTFGTPHTDVAHANASVRAEKVIANLSTTPPSDPLIRLQAGWQLIGAWLQRGGRVLSCEGCTRLQLYLPKAWA
jgi:hypothetical protein